MFGSGQRRMGACSVLSGGSLLASRFSCQALTGREKHWCTRVGEVTVVFFVAQNNSIGKPIRNAVFPFFIVSFTVDSFIKRAKRHTMACIGEARTLGYDRKPEKTESLGILFTRGQGYLNPCTPPGVC